MSEIQGLLLSVAGFLRLIADGHIVVPDHARKEAAELLDKIGAVLASGEDA